MSNENKRPRISVEAALKLSSHEEDTQHRIEVKKLWSKIQEVASAELEEITKADRYMNMECIGGGKNSVVRRFAVRYGSVSHGIAVKPYIIGEYGTQGLDQCLGFCPFSVVRINGAGSYVMMLEGAVLSELDDLPYGCATQRKHDTTLRNNMRAFSFCQCMLAMGELYVGDMKCSNMIQYICADGYALYYCIDGDGIFTVGGKVTTYHFPMALPQFKRCARAQILSLGLIMCVTLLCKRLISETPIGCELWQLLLNERSVLDSNIEQIDRFVQTHNTTDSLIEVYERFSVEPATCAAVTAAFFQGIRGDYDAVEMRQSDADIVRRTYISVLQIMQDIHDQDILEHIKRIKRCSSCPDK